MRLKLSIVIPAFNEERLLGETLRRVNAAREALVARGLESELIVCDNNSTDRTAEIAGAAGALVVFEPVNQIGRARNRGAAAASGDWLLFIDADSHPSAELFVDVVEQIESGRCLAGGAIVQYEAGYPWSQRAARTWNWISVRFRLLAGSFIFCEARVFRQIGGFSHELFASEEIDLSQRLKRIAAKTDRDIVILRRHPLLTSARKVRLYSTWEMMRLLVRALIFRRSTLRNREACHLWYDGRR